MKKILSFVALFVGLGFLASAQEKVDTPKKEVRHRGKAVHDRLEKKSPEEIAKIRTERLDKTLKFTDKQRKEVYTYNLDQAKKHKDRMVSVKKQRDIARQEMKTDRENFKKLLTPDQQKLLGEKLAEHKGKYRIEGREGRFRGKKDGERKMRKQIKEKSESVERSNV